MFPKNGWYAAIWSKDLTGEPVARTFLGEQVVLFRGGNGTAGARWRIAAAIARRRCRSARCEGDHLRCGYHGLTFDTKGQCVSIPGQDTVPVGRAGARLSGRRALQRRLDLDGRSGARRRQQDRRDALARRATAGR